MEMEYSDYYRRPYPAVNMPQAYHSYQQHQQNEQPQQAQQQYQYWNQHQHLVALYQQHQRAALMLGHGGLHGSKQAEPKPRLAKDEVELLEREFAKNPKPNSSTKRELAEQMGVEVPRINVGTPRGRVGYFVLTSNAELVPESPGKGKADEEDGRV
jgi:hypothetical protein